MRKLGPITVTNGVLIPSDRPAPKLTDAARAEMWNAAHFIILGGDNSPEAMKARGYVPSPPYDPERDYGMPQSWRDSQSRK